MNKTQKALDFLAGWVMTMAFPIAPAGVTVLLLFTIGPEELGFWDRERSVEIFDGVIWYFIAIMSACGAWWTVRTTRKET